MVPVDGAWTLNQEDMIEVLRQIKPKIVIPMHIFTKATFDKFLTKIGDLYALRRAGGRTVILTRSELPEKAEILVIPSG
jgi:L-ascorbate metabolism protein UlaG (beta-lactamase superfamily)